MRGGQACGCRPGDSWGWGVSAGLLRIGRVPSVPWLACTRALIHSQTGTQGSVLCAGRSGLLVLGCGACGVGEVRALAYVRVSTREQGASGLSLGAQRAAVMGEASRRGWGVQVVQEVASAKSLKARPVLSQALERLDKGEADVFLVSRMDRAFRSVGDFAGVMARAERRGWLIRMLDPDVDMGTPYGRAMAGVAAVFAQLERELIGQRTREGLAAARARGSWRPRESQLGADVVGRMGELHGQGLSLREVGRRLALEGWETPGGQVAWSHQTVARALRVDAKLSHASPSSGAAQG